MKAFLLVGCLALGLTACTRPSTAPADPQDLVRQFITISTQASGTSDRRGLLALTQGRMRAALEALSDDAFRLAYTGQEVSIKDLVFLKTEIDGTLARVRYEVTILNKQGQDQTEEANEREVELIYLEGKWFIEAIRPVGKDKVAFTRGMIF